MSIDFHYKHIFEDESTTEQVLRDRLAANYDILDITVNEQGVLSYFAVNPKDKQKVIYPDGYEFHLQDDGR